MQALWPRVLYVLGTHAVLVTFFSEILWKRKLLLGNYDFWFGNRISANFFLENSPLDKATSASVTMCQFAIGHLHPPCRLGIPFQLQFCSRKMAAEKVSLHVLRDLHQGNEVFQAMLIEGVLYTDIISFSNDHGAIQWTITVSQIAQQSAEDVFWSAS